MASVFVASAGHSPKVEGKPTEAMHNRSGRPFATLATVNNEPNLQYRRLPPSITHRQHHRQQRQWQAGQSARSHHLPAQCQCAQQRTQPQLPSEEPCDGPNSPTTTSAAAPASSGMLAALLIGCVAMVLAAVHRAAFAVLAVPIQQDLALSPPQMGKLQCALLLGYLCGQVPAGMLADRFGGDLLATVGLFLWSGTCMLISPAASSAAPLPALAAARAALGLAQSCIMPSVATIAARWFPAVIRGRCTSMVYSSYSVGTVLGLMLTPLLAAHAGWSQTFTLLGLAGVAAAAVCGLMLPRERRAAEQRRAWQAPTGLGSLDRDASAHLVVLCFTHSVVSFSFFILQAWIPSFLASTGMSRLSSIGFVLTLPWLATAIVALLAGAGADHLQSRHGWSALHVRHVMQSLAAGGTAVSLLPLALPGLQVNPAVAIAALTAAVAFQGFVYAGLHAYVPEVAPTSAGLVLSITNTCGTLAGIDGNMLTGMLAGSAWGYSGVFALTAALQVVSMCAWRAGAHGRQLDICKNI